MKYDLKIQSADEFMEYIDGIVNQCQKVTGKTREQASSIRARYNLPEIRQVIYNDPATVIIWADGTKTVVKCSEHDEYSPTTGLALCALKKALGTAQYKMLLKYLP